MNNEERPLTLSEAAGYIQITKQGAHKAIKKGLLKAQKFNKRWYINREDARNYMANKFSPYNRKGEQGEQIFDIYKGYCSTKQAHTILCDKLGYYELHQLRYQLKIGKIKSHRKGAAWVVCLESLGQWIKAYKEEAKLRAQ